MFTQPARGTNGGVQAPNLRVHPVNVPNCLVQTLTTRFGATLKHDIFYIDVFANQGVHHGKYRHQPVQKLAQIFVGLQLTIFKPREFYSIEIFAVQSMNRQSCYAMCKVLRIFVQGF